MNIIIDRVSNGYVIKYEDPNGDMQITQVIEEKESIADDDKTRQMAFISLCKELKELFGFYYNDRKEYNIVIKLAKQKPAV